MNLESTISRFEKAGKELSEGTHFSHHQFSNELWKKAGELGLHGLIIPRKLGGEGLSAQETIAALFGFGKGNNNSGLGFGLGAQLLSCTIPLLKHQADRYAETLEKIAHGEFIVAHGISEPASGSDAFAMESRAIKKESQYLLNGSKHFTTNIQEAHAVIFFAMTNPKAGYFGGSTCFFVEADQPGFTKGTIFNKPGLHGCSLGEFRLENVVVPSVNRISEEGLGSSVFATSMLWERLGLTALHLGWCFQLEKVLIEHFRKERKTHPNIDHQSLKHQFVRSCGMNEAFLSQLLLLSEELDHPSRSTNARIGRFKVLVSEHLQQFAHLGCEIIATFNQQNLWIEQLYSDSAATKIYSGTSEIQLNLAAGDLKI